MEALSSSDRHLPGVGAYSIEDLAMGVVDSKMMVAACAGDWVDGVVVVVDYVAVAVDDYVAVLDYVDKLAVEWVVAGACPVTIAPATAADIRTRKAASVVVVEEMDSEAAVLPENDFAAEAVGAEVEKAFWFSFLRSAGRKNQRWCCCSPRER